VVPVIDAPRRHISLSPVLLMAVLILLSLPGRAAATSPEEAIAFANQQRAAYGIPPLTLDQSLLKPECNLEDHEIASPSTSWTATSSPWNDAPWHEATLYDPLAISASYGEYDGFASNDPSFPSSTGTWACMWFGYDEGSGFEESRPVKPIAFYWASEASGPAAVPPTMSAAEWPHTPAEEAGLANPTGPNLIVYATEPPPPYTRIEPTGATVTTAGGESLPAHLVTQGWGPIGIVVIDKPVQPLAGFQVAVNWVAEGYSQTSYTTTQTFGFTTGPPPPPEMPVEEVHVHHSAPQHPHRPRPERIRRADLSLVIHGSTIEVSGSSVLLGHRLEVVISRTWVPCGVHFSDKRCTWVRRGRALTLHRKLTKLVRLHFRAPGPWERVKVFAKTRQFVRQGHRYSEGFVQGTVSGPKKKRGAG
jgi:hypothetical protein